MTTTISAYPLSWPTAWPRNPHPRQSRFGVQFGRARHGLLHELKLLGATDIVISSNLPLRRDGLPYAETRRIDDAGVAVYFRHRGQDQCFPCDEWLTVKDNIHAIALTIGALRGIERWGGIGMRNASFQGFEALPESVAVPNWWDVLGVDRFASRDEVLLAYRRLVKTAHPDAGGDADRFVRIQQAYEQAVAP